jgi:hypothetical protein
MVEMVLQQVLLVHQLHELVAAAVLDGLVLVAVLAQAVVEVVVMVQTIQLAVLELQILAVEAALQAIQEHQILPLVALVVLVL